WRAISEKCTVMGAIVPPVVRHGTCANKLKSGLLAARSAGQRGDAVCAIDIESVARTARVDISRDRLGSRAQRVEKHVEHASLAGELQLAHVALSDVEPRLAEAADERCGILFDHAFEPRHAQDLGRN